MEKENNLKVVEPLVPVNVQSCNEILDWAKEQNFDTVLVVGMKNSKIYWQRSIVDHSALFVGLLEMAKIDMIANDK